MKEKKWNAGSTSWPRLHKGLIESWKLCLNLCLRKWLKVKRNLMTSFTSFGLWELCIEFEDGCINCKTSFLKINRLLELQSLIPNLFYSLIVDEKKKFLKKLCFVLKDGKLQTFFVLFNKNRTEIKLKRYWGCWFFNML